MSSSIFFCQECPTCGRRLQIRVQYLGRQVICQHCHGRLVAIDPTNARFAGHASGNALLQRADDLLRSTDRHSHDAGSHPR